MMPQLRALVFVVAFWLFVGCAAVLKPDVARYEAAPSSRVELVVAEIPPPYERAQGITCWNRRGDPTEIVIAPHIMGWGARLEMVVAHELAHAAGLRGHHGPGYLTSACAPSWELPEGFVLWLRQSRRTYVLEPSRALLGPTMVAAAWWNQRVGRDLFRVGE